MAKSLMLSVVLLCFLSVGSSTHMHFMDCGKFVFQLCFLAVFFLPRSSVLYDHVTVFQIATHEYREEICCLLPLKSLKSANKIKRKSANNKKSSTKFATITVSFVR